jgi:hypothetical protein
MLRAADGGMALAAPQAPSLPKMQSVGVACGPRQ